MTTLPSSRSLMSLAAWTPSSLSAFSMTLFRSSACRSSALIEHPMAPAHCRSSCTSCLDPRVCAFLQTSLCTAVLSADGSTTHSRDDATVGDWLRALRSDRHRRVIQQGLEQPGNCNVVGKYRARSKPPPQCHHHPRLSLTRQRSCLGEWPA